MGKQAGSQPKKAFTKHCCWVAFLCFPPKLWSVNTFAALLGKGHLAMLNRDFDRERCLDDSLSWKRNFWRWEGVGAILPVVIEDWAYHQQLFRDKKGSFIQKAIIIWQGMLQSVAFLMCNCYANKPQPITQAGNRNINSVIYKGPRGQRELWHASTLGGQGGRVCWAVLMLGLWWTGLLKLTIGLKLIP